MHSHFSSGKAHNHRAVTGELTLDAGVYILLMRIEAHHIAMREE
jgi:hypothetical protein